MENRHNTPIYVIVYRPATLEDGTLFRKKLSMSFEKGASIGTDVYLVAREGSDVNNIVEEIIPYANGAFFISQLKEPYSIKGYSSGLDQWLEKNGRSKVREVQVKDMIKKIMNT